MAHRPCRNVFHQRRPLFLGVGEAANWPASVKAVAEWFPRRERALATGIFNGASNFGVAFAAVAVWIAQTFSWQAAPCSPGGLLDCLAYSLAQVLLLALQTCRARARRADFDRRRAGIAPRSSGYSNPLAVVATIPARLGLFHSQVHDVIQVVVLISALASVASIKERGFSRRSPACLR